MWQTNDAIENKLCFRSCGSWYRRPSDLKRHENSCLRGVNIKYVGGPYNTSETIFDKLAKIGVFIPQDMSVVKISGHIWPGIIHEENSRQHPPRTDVCQRSQQRTR